ncbi:hypothetical protein NGRA_1524, partial [Nosema granulosis]
TTDNSILNITDNSILNTTDNSILNTTDNSILNTTTNSILNTTEDPTTNSISNTTDNSILNTTEDPTTNSILNTTEVNKKLTKEAIENLFEKVQNSRNVEDDFLISARDLFMQVYATDMEFINLMRSNSPEEIAIPKKETSNCKHLEAFNNFYKNLERNLKDNLCTASDLPSDISKSYTTFLGGIKSDLIRGTLQCNKKSIQKSIQKMADGKISKLILDVENSLDQFNNQTYSTEERSLLYPSYLPENNSPLQIAEYCGGALQAYGGSSINSPSPSSSLMLLYLFLKMFFFRR